MFNLVFWWDPCLVTFEVGCLVRNSRQDVAFNRARGEVSFHGGPWAQHSELGQLPTTAKHLLGKVTAQGRAVTDVGVCESFGLVLKVRLPDLLFGREFCFSSPLPHLDGAVTCLGLHFFSLYVTAVPASCLQIFKTLFSLEQSLFFLILAHHLVIQGAACYHLFRSLSCPFLNA